MGARAPVVAIVVAAAVLAGCRTGGGGGREGGREPAPAPTAAASAPTTAPPPPPAASGDPAVPGRGEVALRVSGLRLAAAGDGLRLVVDSSAAEVAVAVTGADRALRVCPAPDLERPPAAAPACATPAAGEVVRLPHGPGQRAIELTAAGATQPVEAGVTVVYAPASREVQARLPALAAGSGELSIRMEPAGDGSYRAQASWPGAGSADVTLTVGRSTNRLSGGSGLVSTGSVSPPETGELRVRNPGAAPLAGVVLTVTFP